MVTAEEQSAVLLRIGRELNYGIAFPGERNPVTFNEIPLTQKDIEEHEDTGHRGLRVVLKGNGFYAVGTVVRAQNDWLEFTSEARHLFVEPNFDVTNGEELNALRYIKNRIGLEFKLPDIERLEESTLQGKDSIVLGPDEFLIYEVLNLRELAKKLFLRQAGVGIAKTSQVVA